MSEDLTRRLGKGFSAPEIWKWKRFYQTYPILSTVSIESLQTFLGKLIATLPLSIMTKILPTLSAESQTIGVSLDQLIANLSWSHILELIYLDDPLKRAFYEIEAIKNCWSVRRDNLASG